LLLEHIRKNLPDLRRIINDIQKYSVSGILQIRDEVSTEFVSTIFNKIREKKDLMAIRKEVIENEKEFSNDYRQFQKILFECIFHSDLESTKKANCLLIVSESMYADAFVIDKEINTFAMLIKLSRII
jgi:hypothetical protein